MVIVDRITFTDQLPKPIVSIGNAITDRSDIARFIIGIGKGIFPNRFRSNLIGGITRTAIRLLIRIALCRQIIRRNACQTIKRIVGVGIGCTIQRDRFHQVIFAIGIFRRITAIRRFHRILADIVIQVVIILKRQQRCKQIAVSIENRSSDGSSKTVEYIFIPTEKGAESLCTSKHRVWSPKRRCLLV